MAFVQSAGALIDVQPSWWPTSSFGSLRMYNKYYYDYAALYRMQPNIRTCVDFLARNIAQLGLHVFRRISDTDRERLTDHPLAKILTRPLPAEYKVTRYRLINSLVSDLGIYFNAYWLKVQRAGSSAGLLRIPPPYLEVKGGLAPREYWINLPGKRVPVQPADIVHFRGYNPEDPINGLSPLETLRRILAEEHAAGDYREFFWQNAARMHGILERPKEAGDWTEKARERFKTEFEALYSGGENSGRTAILEEGMTWRQIEFNAQESEYLGGRRLTREECARAFHIPPPMVGILDNATFSNITEQHKNLYQDCLGPWLTMIVEDVDLQLLPEFPDSEDVYTEFNILEKLRGSFEEQTKSLQSAVGRPWMTANEARARMNLPSMGGDAGRLVIPLNVLIGGQASPTDSAPEKLLVVSREKMVLIDGSKALDIHNEELRERHEEKWRQALTRHYKRQQAAILSRIPKGKDRKTDLGGVWWDEDRWNEELYNDLLPLNLLSVTTWAKLVAGALGIEIEEEYMLPWIDEHSQIQAENINASLQDKLGEALLDPEPNEAVKHVFELAISVWAAREAVSAVTTAMNFGAAEGATAGGFTRKTWQVNSSNPRPDHAAMNGTTVGIRDRFPNGMKWPGDPAGGADQNANCKCSVAFS